MAVALRAGDADLLGEVAQAAAQNGLRVEIRRRDWQLPEGRADALVRVHSPEGALDLVADVKTGLTANNFGSVVMALRRYRRESLLITDFVNPKLAERLREEGVFFLDAAGNAFLRGRGLYVWVTGRRNELERQRLTSRVRAFRSSGLQLLFALLCQPESVAADYRTLAQTTGLALGTVAWVMRDLVDAQFVHRRGRTRRVLLRPTELLDAWAQAFAHELRPRLLLGRFAAADLSWWKKTDPADFGALWGGEPAAAQWTGFLKPGTLTLWADKLPARLLAVQRLKRSADGQVEVLKKFWRFEAVGEARGLVPPALAYADLLAIADSRTLEAARRLFEQQIDGPFRAYLSRTAR